MSHARTDDPLLSACGLVGSASGIAFAAPASWEQESRSRTPLAALCRASGVRSRRVALRGRWWCSDSGPMLAFLAASGSPVALLPSRPGHYELVDPREDTRLSVDEETAGQLRPFAYVFYRPIPGEPTSALRLLLSMFPDVRSDLSTIALTVMVMSALNLALPIATARLLDNLLPQGLRSDLTALFVALFALALGSTAFDLARAFALVRVETKWGSAVQSAVVDRLLSLPVAFFRNYTVGDLAIRTDSVRAARRVLAEAAVTGLLACVSLMATALLLFLYSPRLALPVVGLLLGAVSVHALFGASALRYERRRQRLDGQIAGLVFQIISGVAKLRTAAAEARAFGVWSARFREQRLLGFSAGQRRIASGVLNDVLPLLATATLFTAAAPTLAGTDRPFSIGQFLAVQVAMGAFLAAGVALSNTLVGVVPAFPALERARPILEATPEVSGGRRDPGSLAGGIEVRRVSFRYREDGPLVLQDVSLEARPGEFVAIVGPSGSGKSTLLRLLLAFETPESGTIAYDGRDFATLDASAVRGQIGVVMQASRVFSGDLFTNIVGAAPLSVEDAWEAAELAGLAEDIRSLPMGMHTVVSEGGATFSGGQRQRLLLARALVRQPRMLFLDEATSALDANTQELIRASLERTRATRLTIAHRLSTVRNADRIYVMQDGRVIDYGRYERLAVESSLFARLIARQLT